MSTTKTKKLKVLCEWSPGGPHYVRSGWLNAFRAAGHEVAFWVPRSDANRSGSPAFDALDRYFGPSEGSPCQDRELVYLGTTYGDRAVWKWFKACGGRPDIKMALFASAWGPLLDRMDLKKYPLVVASEQEKREMDSLKKETGHPSFVFIHSASGERLLEGCMSGWKRGLGIEPHCVPNAADTTIYRPSPGTGGDPRLACDASYVGGLWPYKGRNIERFIYPLCRAGSPYNIKIFGGNRWPLPQYLGTLSQSEEEVALYNSSSVCLSVSEPHSTDEQGGLQADFVERPYKVMACGAFCLSDYVREAAEHLYPEGGLVMARTPKEYEENLAYYLSHPDQRMKIARKGHEYTLRHHTYFHRMAFVCEKLGLHEQAEGLLSCAAS